MGHIDDPHDTEDERKAKGDEGDDEPPDQAIDKKKKDGRYNFRQRKLPLLVKFPDPPLANEETGIFKLFSQGLKRFFV